MSLPSEHPSSTEYETIRIYGLVDESIVDGPGLRFSVFVQGCSHHCPGCHNPESHQPDGGSARSIDCIIDQIHANKLIGDVTLSGGEPFEQAQACSTLAGRLKDEGYGIWVFTGYLYEDLLRMAESNASIAKLLACTDVLVDGPFVESLRSIELDWRGSSNQRVIDLRKTEEAGRVVIWQQPIMSFEKPANW